MAAETLFEKVTLTNFMPLPEGSEQYPLEYIENNKVIKLIEAERSVTVGICDPENRELLDNLRLYHRKEIILRLSRTLCSWTSWPAMPLLLISSTA